jgi:hypothetical protein
LRQALRRGDVEAVARRHFAVRVGRAALELQNAVCAQTCPLGQRLLREALRQAMLPQEFAKAGGGFTGIHIQGCHLLVCPRVTGAPVWPA